MSLSAALLLRIDTDSLPAEMLPPALLSLAELVRPIEQAGQAFLVTVLPVMMALPDPALRKRVSDLARFGIALTRLTRELEAQIARPMPVGEPEIRALASAVQIWALVAIEMGSRARALQRDLAGAKIANNP